jgi:hypothetical protein
MAHHGPDDRDDIEAREEQLEKIARALASRMRHQLVHTLPERWYSAAARTIVRNAFWQVIREPGDPPARRRIVLPPGAWLNRVTRFLLTREAHARFIEPIIRDMQVEYCDALAAGDIWHAQWIRVRGHLLVFPNWAYAWIARTVKGMFSSL